MTIHMVDGKMEKAHIYFMDNCCFSCQHSKLVFTVSGGNFFTELNSQDVVKRLNGPVELVALCEKQQFFCAVRLIDRCIKGYEADHLQCRKGCWEPME